MESDKSTHRKALKINLDDRYYGTFAEIGAGQEVARWLFRVGGAANKVAKSISAYDMGVSDAIYGKSSRYVSKDRLQAMLDKELELDIERLSGKRGDTTAFFAFADTVAAKSYKGNNECHGWMGIKFQASPRDTTSQITLHVRMLDSDPMLQQEALGIIGINLIFGAFYLRNDTNELIESLLDCLNPGRIEIDLIEFSGIEFRTVDNRAMALKLVQLGLSGCAMFGPKGVLQPSEFFYKKSVIVERGSFRPPTLVNLDMMKCASEWFTRDNKETPTQVFELTMRNLTSQDKSVDLKDFIARAELLSTTGIPVMISDFQEYYKLAAYIGRQTKEKIGLVMGIPSLKEIFDEKYYSALPGGILESFGRLFKNDLKLYVYPWKSGNETITVDSLKVSTELQMLYDYLRCRGSFFHLSNFNPQYLDIYSREVLKMIQERDSNWENMVPESVAKMIKERNYFL